MELSYILLVLFIIFRLFHLQHYAYADDERYEDCNKPFECGTVSNLSYPFYDGHIRPDYCGYPGFQLDCSSSPPDISVAPSERYYVIGVKPDQPIVTVARKDYWDGYCPGTLHNTSINFDLFNYVDLEDNVTIYYGCPDVSTPMTNSFICANFSDARSPFGYFVANDSESSPSGKNIPRDACNRSITVPVTNYESSALRIVDTISLMAALRYGFELEWKAENDVCNKCRKSGGECGYNTTMSRFTCYCPDQPYASKCPGSSHLKKELKTTLIIIVLGLALIAVALLSFTRTKASQKLILTKEERKDSHDVEVMLKRYGEYAPKRYTYGEIKKMTSCFQEKLGEGGYGGVYKGKLQDGSPVAVKLLKNPNCKGTDFINEVASISETNHVNIVTLLGYCYQGRKRALVYEFLPNGSLDKYIYCGQNQNSIAWETLLQIVIGIGRGLEYLHQGCRTRILHFDIKPHNILLDAKFCPKISDFGLAKSYVQTKSLMTMSGTRGTPGYIAPEVFCRGFGGASHKSDVYSFGMLVLDLVGCRKNSIAGSEKTSSELYFPHYIYKQFELKEDHELLGISNDEEKVIQKKLVIVSLWCIQTNPSSRPSISRAVEMLEGDIELLQIPPIPSLSSPPKSHHQHDSSTNNATLELQLTNGSSE
ncbi:LEAF RUST 10 DISEASE-RESISTANCE LOCUS RECEPTOR-LIKE PROTEIN KINASE-like 2.1 isoform X3 [Chenopodium quinoa]|uniref:LEAF RUST 10 DISEASE-RESISTANCE LOCUS RECEPTOR-LIKE PROTEIN KINASE-like 2.1 isoform X3 n=1 Tax=Chenopodium quinoa TaxID=63459 RepID=UPI000B78C814|nr:LEAF RUST 10 DISEASE-RESISTANCE LOCUS RECEPTOR-LIKE PROTEIN KINASE-like 2.1 isoform X3 [Chenopodium quinoa]